MYGTGVLLVYSLVLRVLKEGIVQFDKVVILDKQNRIKDLIWSDILG